LASRSAGTVEGVYAQDRWLWVRLCEKGRKRHAMPCHHNMEEYLIAYLAEADLRDDPEGPLFARSVAAPASPRAQCCCRRTPIR
jgi:hypothetical protein